MGALIVIGLYLILGLTEGINSIAVLPFINSERDPEVEYLSDGITETIINTISRLPDVKVIARASVFHYKGRDVDPRTVGRELDVRAVLAGRVVRRGENLVISAELIDTRDNRQIWGERYNRGFSDILETQEEIALRISENLSIRLSGEEKEALAKRHTRDTEAYDLYLRGRYHMQAYDQASLTKAQEYFERAIEIDPSYALSYVGIAESYYYLSNVFIHPHEAMPNARTAALKALEIDPNLAEAHAALAVVSATYGWDWETAERAYKRALKLKPSHAQTHQWYGHFLIAMGRPREALAELRSASELDPLSTVTAWVAVLPYVYAPPEERQYDAAIREIENILETDPNFFPAHNLLALVYEQQNQFVHAIDELQRSVELAGEAMTSSIALLGHAYALSGDRTKAERALNRLLEIRKEQHTSTFFIALLYLGLDDPDRAIDWLERAYENRDEDLIYSGVDPRLDTLRADARFSDLLRRMGLDR